MAPRFTFIGLGRMGQEISENLLRYGDIKKPLVVYNRTKSKADAHSARLPGCTASGSIPDAITDSDIIWSCLLDQEAVEETFRSILQVDIKGKLFVDSSTINPRVTNSISERVLNAGGEFVAMPVMGDPTVAAKRGLVCFASGDSRSVDRIRPYVQGVISRRLVDMSGESPGAAPLLKLVGNFLIMATIETVAEAHTFAEKCGAGIDNMDRLISAVFPNSPHSIYSHRMFSGEYYSGMPMVEIDKAISLTSEVMDLAKECGASIKLYEVAREHLEMVKQHKGPAVDITGIYGAVRMESGLPFNNDPVQGVSR